ncbi:hypothetical protein [Stakelama tenebrarum]|uniref:Uncharacterized protein n=1 Tax=Stakelama tenebrarum TaxID=2711215 RepID=A0A6G6Y6F5_9SPHN|nr:hypothetical protein [Sphingosinithalassobacter tenebrarum]QIG80377.1 hypothetical protein G5C33_11710 [Sphingosinithalassobacter tenebrarum]
MTPRRSIAFALAILLPLAGCATLTGGKLVREGEVPGRLVVRNNAGMPITALTISRCDAMSHGLSRISNPIPNGGAVSFNVGPGCWDVMAGAGGYCGSGGCSWQQKNHRFTMVSRRSHTVTFTPSPD